MPEECLIRATKGQHNKKQDVVINMDYIRIRTSTYATWEWFMDNNGQETSQMIFRKSVISYKNCRGDDYIEYGRVINE